jgi:hypothetical protein
MTAPLAQPGLHRQASMVSLRLRLLRRPMTKPITPRPKSAKSAGSGTSVPPDPADEPALDPADEPALEPADDPFDEPKLEPADEPFEEPALVPAEDPFEEPELDPADEPALEPALEPADEPADEPLLEPLEPVWPHPGPCVCLAGPHQLLPPLVVP